jgi:hypothetical protein
MQKDKYEGGASRNKLNYRFDLIPPAGIERIAARFELGVKSHGENNWRKGGPDFVKASVNHMVAHVMDYLENGNDTDDNLGAIGWAVCALAHFEKQGIAWVGNKHIDSVHPQLHLKK